MDGKRQLDSLCIYRPAALTSQAEKLGRKKMPVSASKSSTDGPGALQVHACSCRILTCPKCMTWCSSGPLCSHCLPYRSHQGSNCLGADTLIQLLKNYCRNTGIKTAITVRRGDPRGHMGKLGSGSSEALSSPPSRHHLRRPPVTRISPLSRWASWACLTSARAGAT